MFTDRSEVDGCEEYGISVVELKALLLYQPIHRVEAEPADEVFEAVEEGD